MQTQRFRSLTCLLIVLLWASFAAASAFNHKPKLVVLIVVDQFRADYLERMHDQLAPGGFRLLMDQGAYFTDCYYQYANTKTAPGHATLGTGAYSNGHGIAGNEWWDPQQEKVVSSVEDPRYQILGGTGEGVSPHNLLASTLADELRLATGGASRTFGVSLKDRSAILPVGYSANAAYWIDHESGAIVTSSYYMQQLPKWVIDFNASQPTAAYWNREWKDANGRVLRDTKVTDPRKRSFYDAVGSTPFINDYELGFTRKLIEEEGLGQGSATDFLSVSISSFDILGHKEGPNSDQMRAMTLALDKQLESFFQYLEQRFGRSNVWIALSADHGVAPVSTLSRQLHIPSQSFDARKLKEPLNAAIAKQLGHNAAQGDYVEAVIWPYVFLDDRAFAGIDEAHAEALVGDLLRRESSVRNYFTRSQLNKGEVPADDYGRLFLRSASPLGGWYVMLVGTPYYIPWTGGTDHFSPYRYDQHVPLLFYGPPFKPGTYRTHAEPVDLVATLSSLLGINEPTHAVGRVLTEALVSGETSGARKTSKAKAR
jgi:predicted AlkP superfamily pyrophosphatase or phosphodiesterase